MIKKMNYRDKTKQLMKNYTNVERVPMGKKWYGLLGDNETVNNDKLIVEFGVKVVNNHLFNIENYNVIIKEVWENKNVLYDKTRTNYAIGKIPEWERRIANGELQVKSIYEITKDINALIKKYDIKYYIAYNVKFDKEATINTDNILNVLYAQLKYLKVIDIWYATNCITTTRDYVKWALANNYTTPKGNIKTSAEVVYRYLSYKNGFEETHIAIDDIEIELEILKALLFKRDVFLISGLKNNFNYYSRQQKKFFPKLKKALS